MTVYAHFRVRAEKSLRRIADLNTELPRVFRPEGLSARRQCAVGSLMRRMYCELVLPE
jgi:hypothetical protein